MVSSNESGKPESVYCGSYGGFYQQIASWLVRGSYTKAVSCDFGDRLIALAEHAHAFRQMNTLEQVSKVLMNLPLPAQYEAIGRYYQALCIHKFGRGDIEQSACLFERAAEEAPLRYKLRAMQSLGANSIRKGDYQSALSLYSETGRFASRVGLNDAHATVCIQRGVAIIRGLEGNHLDALALLENLLPLARAVRSSHPHIYYGYLNNLAVELGEVGRLEEAQNVCKIVLASPYASAYPEWRETQDEIALRGWRASRSLIAFSQNDSGSYNLVQMPIQEPGFASAELSPANPLKQARVFNYLDWKNKMVKEPSDTPQYEKLSQKLDDREMILKIIQLASAKERTAQELEQILDAVERIVSLPGHKSHE